MTIKNVFTDTDKHIDIIIDGYTSEPIPVKKINRLATQITINQLNNTALKDDIIVDATLSPIKKAVLTVSLWSLDKSIQYYTSNISTDDGHIYCKIPNEVQTGHYIVTIEYAGSKYYQNTSVDRQIEIKRREIVCKFDSKIFYVKPNQTFTTTFQLIDKINNQSINNCQISYLYNDETFNVISDNNGNVDIEIQVPNTNASHCLTNTVTYPIIFYLDDSDSYLLKDTTIKLFIDKIDTELFVRQVDNTIQGNVSAQNQQVNYGDVEILILNSYKINTQVDSGIFQTNAINADTIINNLQSSSDGMYQSPMNISTILNLEAQETQIDVGDEIGVIATVTDAKGHNVIDGLVDFKMYDSNNKKIYRYATELDNAGQALFMFYTSKKGTYTINATYESMVRYKPSTSKKNIIITVGD